MTDHPMLFSGAMVRAELDDRKTNTRRALKPANTLFDGRAWTKLAKAQQWDWEKAWVDEGPSPMGNPGPYLKLPWLSGDEAFAGTTHRIYPKIQPGDRIWVRETWKATGLAAFNKPRETRICGRFAYQADAHQEPRDMMIPWTPSIHMPRWASRITLTVAGVKIERLQDISEEDAIAEGVRRNPHGNGDQWMDYPEGSSASGWFSPRDSFRSLWIMINGLESWNANPWVIAYTFTVDKRNIDAVAGSGPC